MTIDVGVLGAGNIAKNRHVPVFKNNDRARITGIVDRIDSRGQSVAADLEIPYCSTNTELCEHADLISVCTPPWLHRDHTIEALNNGCHVLTEKPMAMSTEEADDMMQAAETNDRMLTVVQNFLYKDAFSKLRKLIDNGQLGEISRTYAIQLKKTDHQDRHNHEWFEKLPGGLFWDESPHMIYLTNDFIGDMEVHQATATPRGSEKQSYKDVRARFNGKDDIEGNLVMLFDSPVTEWWFVTIGSEGIALIDIPRDTILQFDREDNHSAKRVLFVLLRGVGQLLYGGVTTGVNYFQDRIQSGYTIPEAGFSIQVDRTLRELERDDSPPVTAENGRNVVNWMEDIVDKAQMRDN